MRIVSENQGIMDVSKDGETVTININQDGKEVSFTVSQDRLDKIINTVRQYS